MQTIGWREWVSIPDLGIAGIKAKIDTGARSSCLHTHDFEVYENEAGEERVRFHLHPLVRTNSIEVSCDWPVNNIREVKDSGGHVELRPFILVAVQLGENEWDVELSLSNREGMKFRMLLGRTALKERFIVDPTKSYRLSTSLAHKYGAEIAAIPSSTN
ncbi:MAG: ATP-dependent zinc protease [Verrucomicrobiales bacterium]|nr:ATP-dependent zinc protease [Verrucomicrobiales bacterium]